MIPLPEIKNKILDLKRLIQADQQSEIRLKANGGNTILLVTPPEQEIDFINKMFELLDENEYQIIDINQLLVSFVDQNKDEINKKFDLLKSSVQQIFKSPEGEDNNDFYHFLINRIKEAYQNAKIPVLINTGALYGTGIENIHIMESKTVMEASRPLVILYPATDTQEQLMFLNSRPASKYRCVILK